MESRTGLNAGYLTLTQKKNDERVHCGISIRFRPQLTAVKVFSDMENVKICQSGNKQPGIKESPDAH